MIRTVITLLALALVLLIPAAAPAQSLGTFRWQLQPYCNVLTVTVVQDGGQYHLDGTDDQCGATRKASVVGLAFPNPDGTIGFGLTIVTAPGGAPVHVDAEIALATLGGTWRDNTGGTGTFAFTPGGGTGGTPRPPAAAAIPPAFLLAPTGSFLATGAIGAGAAPASGPGVRMMWYPGKAAFRAGRVSASQWDDANVGPLSAAMGLNTKASGPSSTAMGGGTTASGEFSTAMGFLTRASGFIGTAMGLETTAGADASTAMGQLTTASAGSSTAMGFGTRASGGVSTAMGQGTTAGGTASTAMGQGTTADGTASTAMGEGTKASGQASTALGGNTTANGNYSVAVGFGSTTTALFGFAGGNHSSAGDTAFAFGQDASALGVGSVALGWTARTTAAGPGSFMFADRSTSAAFQSNAPNEFGARFAGGYYFYTSSDLSTGAVIGPGGGDWTALSDANAKENFRDVDGEELLAKLARIPIREWNYKAQSADIRHVGPTAQDFRAAFGLGDFPLRINTIDADGVALAGVKALENRTRRLQEENSTLHEALEELRGELKALKARVSP